MIKSTSLSTFTARELISPRFPMGVDKIYKPLCRASIFFIFIFLISCAPVNIKSAQKDLIKNDIFEKEKAMILEKKINYKGKTQLDAKIINEIEIILPKLSKKNITSQLINSFELSLYKKEIQNLNLNINRYSNLENLNLILEQKASPGKIFIGTLDLESSKLVKNYCNRGILFFSFAPEKEIANDCVYLINFFPEDDLRALFNFFPAESKVALLYPENYYGFNINKIIDPIASKSKSLIINRSSYKEDLTNAREAIKELGKYDLRKYELQRQKKILENRNDEISKSALKKIKNFETLGSVDFTHLILPDYGIRLLEIAPLLPFYDVDPNKVRFVGTGVWDDSLFFDEPSLQGAIFSGIEKSNRENFFNDYEYIFNQKPMRTATIPYDLIGIITHIINENLTLGGAYKLLDSSNIKFDGIDGKFFFVNNIIYRELDILKINNGEAKKLN